MSVDVLYTTTSSASGGRDGHAKSHDGPLDVTLTTPKELGGNGGNGVNPEQLFSSAYAACFIGAMKFVAEKEKVTLPDSLSVDATVGIGPLSAGGFGLTVSLNINCPDLDQEQTKSIVEKAHYVCPYSNATRGNVDVQLNIS